jgi:putative transposase
MSKNYYSEINLHLTWHTKESQPLIAATVEPLLHRFLKQKTKELGGIYVHEIGGIETHIHLAISIEPTVLISDLVGTLKGYTSFEVNHQSGRKENLLQWQTGYGVVSFGTKDLPWVREYIRNQRQHHAGATIQERLERIEYDETRQWG